MLAEKAKEQTGTNHQLLEKKIIAKLKDLQSTDDYLHILQLFYGYFGGLEDKINQHIGTEELPDIAHRRKSAQLAGDIKSLGGTPAAKAVNGALPDIDNAASAFGALYVIEGSTLGGSIISKMVSGKLGIQSALSFFNSYGENTPAMWHTFKNTLNVKVITDEDQAAMIGAANETFSKFNTWIEQHG